MKIILKTLIIFLFVSLFFTPEVTAADNWIDWCKPVERDGKCTIQQKSHLFWPFEWIGSCSEEFYKEVDSNWCSNNVILEKALTTDNNNHEKNNFNPGETVYLRMRWINASGSLVITERKYHIITPDNVEVEVDSSSFFSANSFDIHRLNGGKFPISKDAKEGKYIFRGLLTYNGETQEAKAQFYVSQGTPDQAPLESAGGVTLEEVYTADDKENKTDQFKTGDVVSCAMSWKNETGGPVSSVRNYQIINPSNMVIHKDSGSSEITATKQITLTEYVLKKIDESGKYTCVGSLTYNNEKPREIRVSFYVKQVQGEVTLEEVYTTRDGQRNSNFKPDDTVGLCVKWKNKTGDEVNQRVKFKVLDSQENEKHSNHKDEKTAEEDITSCSAWIKKGTEPGHYKFEGSLYGNTQALTGMPFGVPFEVIPAEAKPGNIGVGNTSPGRLSGGTTAVGDKKTRVATNTQAYIHGYSEGTFDYRDLQENWISVGSMTWVDSDKSKCLAVPIPMELTFSKLNGDKEQNISVSNIPVYESNLLDSAHQNHRTCWSYKANLTGMDKKGIYKLTAKFPGNDTYKPSDSTVEVEFTGGEKARVKTITAVATSETRGVAVKREGDQIKLIKEGGSQETIIFTPQSYVIGGVCNQDEIPLVHFTVVKVNRDGTTEVIYDNPTYPNCEPYTFYVYEQDYYLDDIDRIEASAILPEDSESEYASSRGDITIKVSEEIKNVVEAQTYVDLVSTPFGEDVRFGDNVLVIAATNKAVPNPVFKVIHNGGEEWIMPATSSNNACQFKSTTCQYSFILLQVNGDYDISFENDGVSDSLSFSTQPEPVGQITSVGLLVNGEEIPLSLEGGLINLHLDGSPTNSFLIVIHYADGTELRKNLVFEYSPETAPTPITRTCPYQEAPQGCPYGGIRECTGIYRDDVCVYDDSGQVPPDCQETCNPASNTCAYTESFNCTGQNGGCGPGSGEMRKTIINTDCRESSISYCDEACAPPPVPPPPECEDVYYCDNGTTIHKYGYHDGNTCQYVWDDIGEPC